MGRHKLKLEGQKFGRVVVINSTNSVNERGHSLWNCLCLCGNNCVVSAKQLRPGRGTPSCGCFDQSGKNNPAFVHGLSRTPEYAAYMNALRRCTNPEHEWYPDYGGRGIKFKLISVQQMLDEIGIRPTEQHSLDRIDNDGNYESGNIRWATKTEQMLNQRRQYRRTT